MQVREGPRTCSQPLELWVWVRYPLKLCVRARRTRNVVIWLDTGELYALKADKGWSLRDSSDDSSSSSEDEQLAPLASSVQENFLSFSSDMSFSPQVFSTSVQENLSFSSDMSFSTQFQEYSYGFPVVWTTQTGSKILSLIKIARYGRLQCIVCYGLH